MKFSPKISIIIPVYNGTNYLEGAVRSAIRQTYDNFEILIVNDGSTDKGKTAELAKRLQREKPELIRYFEKPNGGVASALNMGIREMTGEFFSWLSHDDGYAANKLARQIEVLSSLPEAKRRSTIVYSDFDLIGAVGKKTASVRFQDQHSPESLKRSLYPLLNGLMHGCALLIPVRAIREEGGFDESLKYTQDYDLWLRLLLRYEVQHIPEPLILWRIHAEQDSRNCSIQERRQQEEDSLWIKIFSSVTSEMRIELEGSEENFFRKILALLEVDRFPKAHRLALSHWKTWRNSPPISSQRVSVVIPVYQESIGLEATLQSVFEQTHKNIEVLLVEMSGSIDGRVLDSWLARNVTTNILKGSGNLSDAMQIAGEKAAGSVLSFLCPGDRFVPEKTSLQLAFMEATRSRFVHSSYVEMDSEGNSKAFVSSAKGNFSFPSVWTSSRQIAFSSVLIEKELLMPFLRQKFTDPRLLWGRITRQYPIQNLDFPLVLVRPARTIKAFAPKWSELDRGEVSFWLRARSRRFARRSGERGWRFVKAAAFEWMPFSIQLRIRQLLS